MMFPSVGWVGDGGRAVSVSPWAGTATGEGACVPVCGFWPYLGAKEEMVPSLPQIPSDSVL